MTKHSTMNHVHIAGRILHEVPMNVCSVSGDREEGGCWDDLKIAGMSQFLCPA